MSHELGSLFPILESLKNTFTKSEEKVMQALLENPEEVIYSSITDLAEKAGVGDSTVMRFCRKAGFKGYQDFKMFLARELAANETDDINVLNNELRKDDNVDVIAKKIIDTNIKALRDTAALLNPKDVEAAVTLIENSRTLTFYGVGSSGITAIDAKNTFMRAGLKVNAFYGDSHMQAMSAALLTEEDLAIAISYSGANKDTVKILQIAKESGAKTICITHYSKSPIVQYADIILLSGHKEGPLQGGALTTRVAQMFVVDVLYTEYFRRNIERVSKNRQKASKAISDKLY